MSTYRFTRQRTLSPTDLGVNGLAINTAQTSNAIDVTGVQYMSVEIRWTKGAGTGVKFYLDESLDGGTTWVRKQVGDLAAGDGIEVLSDHGYSKTLAASGNFCVADIPLNDKLVRISGLIALGSPNASDTAIARVILGVL